MADIWRNKFKSLKNHCTQLMRKAKCSFFSDFVKENSNNQGTLFKAIKGMLVGKNAISFPGRNETALVNELGKYFVQKISNIHSEINNEISSNDDAHVDPSSDATRSIRVMHRILMRLSSCLRMMLESLLWTNTKNPVILIQCQQISW